MNRVELKKSLNEFLGSIPEAIISRGWSYFRDGRVLLDGKTDRQQSFLVSGGDEYQVTFTLPGSGGKSGKLRAGCNCPAAKPCKHQVAAAFFVIHSLDGEQMEEMRNREVSPERPYFHLQVHTRKRHLTLAGSEDMEVSVQKRLQLADVRKALGPEFFRKEADIFSPGKTARRPFILDLLKKLPGDMIRIQDEKGKELVYKGVASPFMEASLFRSPEEESVRQSGALKLPPLVRLQAFVDDRRTKKRRGYPEHPFRLEKGVDGKSEVTFFEIPDRSLSFYASEGIPLEYDHFLKLMGKEGAPEILLEGEFPVPCIHGPFPAVEIRLDPASEEEPILQVRSSFRYFEEEPSHTPVIGEAGSDGKGAKETKKKKPVQSKGKQAVQENGNDPEVDTGIFQDVQELELLETQNRVASFPLKNPGKIRIDSDQPSHFLDLDGNIARRNIAEEARIFNLWRERGLSSNAEREIRSARFRGLFFDEIPEIISMGIPVYLETGILELAIQKARQIAFQVGHSSGINWFDGKFLIQGLDEKETATAINAFRMGRRFFKDSNGKWVHVQDIGLEKALRTVEDLGLKLGKEGIIGEISPGALFALERELEVRSEGLKVETREKFLQWSHLKTGNFQVPPGFQANLRPYQLEGASFFLDRHRVGMGGILADDMGLGKTVQALAFLNRLFVESDPESNSKSRGPYLIVAPVAALSVWEGEANRFAPELPVTVWHGSTRKDETFPESGAVITSFGVLTKDIDLLKKLDFETIIIDEAQFAKNYLSKISRALRELQTKTIFCLTGTPMENHATELWALVDLILPGYLGSRRLFHARYRKPDEDVIAKLRRRLSPVLLRRRRSEVLNELPEKSVQNLVVPMTRTQSILYESVRQEAQEALSKAGNHYLMTMLPYLTRLRRIACHPGLDRAGEGEDPTDSGKLSLLLDQLEEIESSASGILVFSQFTDVLDLFQASLKARNTDFFRIDGSTTAAKRADQVKRFQAGEKQYFLISLKAGGSALTLHRADTVIHLDPWWNPAVEEQATARAHRMGQQRNVFVYRYISEGSVEEKVVHLQEKKKKLFEDVLDHPESGAKGSISREEILALLDM